MATKRKTPIENTNSNKKLQTLEYYESREDDHDRDREDVTIPSFPGLVIDQILQHLPTTLAVSVSIFSKQWKGVWSSVPVLDFDEGEPYDNDEKLENLRRKKFIKFLRGCLKFREKDKCLDKFRLRMRYRGKSRNIEKWLSFAIERSVKVLEISLPRKPKFKYYCLSKTILNAKSITTLNLESLRITDDSTSHPISLPSVKTLSLKTVHFGRRAFSNLISRCPSIECLTLISCNFAILNGTVKVSFCSLESF
ncbi:hypothetical protein PRUPE_8G124800 [Prunus persica]|uniref:F-box/LRR-repeat protein 15/At3g58940/PEG3-like LRR domain-containing protein n=1 Tax=Prunus persica TaxID=3760 RepID=M5VHE4_PRUPE|nr:F-box/FBD/LRR-repeat protein At5g22700 [Prunus persica]ONH91586.1 hypothetical protein PRUPE_8G124800 [Prunus persica]